MNQVVFLVTVIGLMIHIAFSVSVYMNIKKLGNEVPPFMKVFAWFPIFNVLILNVIITDQVIEWRNKNEAYKEAYENLKDHKSDELIRAEKRYKWLEKAKFRKIKVGDTFVIPNEKGWIEACRGKKCVITSIVEKGVNHSVEGVSEEYITNWAQLKEMVFLSTEPDKPFEFNF